MVRAAGLATIGILAAVGLAACGGGGGGQAAKSYSLSATRACLDKAGYDTAVVKNVYFPGTQNLRVRLDKAGARLLNPQERRGGAPEGEYVFLVFAKDANGAAAAEKKALAMTVKSLRTRGFFTTTSAVKTDVGLDGNVFYYSSETGVTTGQRAKITPCLR